MTALFPRLVSTGLLLLSAATCTKTEDATPAATAGRDDNLALGNPSGATASTGIPANYLLVSTASSSQNYVVIPE